MSAKTPKPTTSASADSHRQEDDDDDDVDTAAIPSNATPTSGGDGGIGSGGDGPASGSGGSMVTGLLSNKKVVFGLAAIGAVLGLYWYLSNTGSSPLDGVDTDPGEAETGDEEDEEPPMPNIQAPDHDPLAADEQAFGWVFGDMKQNVRGGEAGD